MNIDRYDSDQRVRNMMIRTENGDWVRYEDIAPLLAAILATRRPF